MKLIILLSLFFNFYIFSFSQTKKQIKDKPIIDTGMLGTWPSISSMWGSAILSKDGRCAAFTIDNQPVGSKTLIIQDVMGNWKKEIIANYIGFDFYFSSDGKKFCWQNGDSLFLQTKDSRNATLVEVVNMSVSPSLNKGEWIAFKKKDALHEVILLNLVTGKQTSFSDVEDVAFDDEGTVLLIQSAGQNPSLKWLDLKKNRVTPIWTGNKGSKAGSYYFDRAGRQLSFMVTGPAGSSVFYYKTGMEKAIERIGQKSRVLSGSLTIGGISGFTVNGWWLFIKLIKSKPAVLDANPNMTSVDVWSYRDEVLQPMQPIQPDIQTTVELVIDVNSDSEGILLNPDGVKVVRGPIEITGDYTILSSDTFAKREYWWSHQPQPNEWLTSLKDGSRRLLPQAEGYRIFSPGGRWLTWWDYKEGAWMSYEIATGVTLNMSKTVPVPLYSEVEYTASTFKRPVYAIDGWFKDDSALLIYDTYDIWKVDPACRNLPVNLTEGYGRKNKIEFRSINEESVYAGQETILLSGFSQETKQNGFFRKTLNKSRAPEKLTFGPFTWYRSGSQGGFPRGMKPVEAGKGKFQSWLLMRQSATDFPQYFYTRNFKQFKALTNLAPHKSYNWLTAELVSWTLPDGRKSQGVLYKPENFDSSQKYPVIFNYYEKTSYNMYDFQGPGLAEAVINIPWFVSRGYLVCLVDIYYGDGSKTGISSGRYALNAVESAAIELCKRPYTDSTCLAIQGHSFGGLETNYILTHSKRFAAAAENAGFTDVMSSYLTLTGGFSDDWKLVLDIGSTQAHKERDHELYGGTPWQYPNLYLDNSPVWSADKASAPLLIFHNKNDQQVQWRQGVEMYMALRRLSKPCWMLQYDNSTHLLDNKNDALDYTIRLTQFFDHYLKGAPAPRWMTEGIPAKLKQVESRYELDTNGNCSIDCKVCKKWNNNREP